MNECYDEEENRGLSEDEKDMQHDAELLAEEGNYGVQMSHDGSGGVDGNYNQDFGVGDDDAGTRCGDDFFNGDNYYNDAADNYYNDAAAAGFDDGYNGDDGGDGPDGWW
jgi:hypothetical protein